MNVLSHPVWPLLRPYAKLARGRDNVDLLQLPADLRTQALAVKVHCVACGTSINCFRARLKSQRARVTGTVEEHRLFYAATCEATRNSGCARSRDAKEHKREMRRVLGGAAAGRAAEVVAKIDAALQFAPTACREAMLAAREILACE